MRKRKYEYIMQGHWRTKYYIWKEQSSNPYVVWNSQTECTTSKVLKAKQKRLDQPFLMLLLDFGTQQYYKDKNKIAIKLGIKTQLCDGELKFCVYMPRALHVKFQRMAENSYLTNVVWIKEMRKWFEPSREIGESTQR